MDKLIINNQLQNNEENINFHFHVNKFDAHTHDYYEIMLITKGNATHYINGKEYKTKEGDCWFIFPSSIHSLFAVDFNNSKHLNIAITSTQMRTLCNVIDVSFLPYLQEKKNEAIRITLVKNDFDRILSLTHKFQAQPSNNITKRNGLLNILASALIQIFYIQHTTTENNKIPVFLQKLIQDLSSIEYLELRPCEIINNIPYSYSHFEKIFKKFIGISFVQYLNNRKIEYAKSLLITTDLSIIQIANKIELPTLGHFYNIFKRQTGITPLQYRKKHTGTIKLS